MLPCLGYCKGCCSECWDACILSDHVFLWIHAQEWDCRSRNQISLWNLSVWFPPICGILRSPALREERENQNPCLWTRKHMLISFKKKKKMLLKSHVKVNGQRERHMLSWRAHVCACSCWLGWSAVREDGRPCLWHTGSWAVASRSHRVAPCSGL